jgi:hypothetical protein
MIESELKRLSKLEDRKKKTVAKEVNLTFYTL